MIFETSRVAPISVPKSHSTAMVLLGSEQNLLKSGGAINAILIGIIQLDPQSIPEWVYPLATFLNAISGFKRELDLISEACTTTANSPAVLSEESLKHLEKELLDFSVALHP